MPRLGRGPRQRSHPPASWSAPISFPLTRSHDRNNVQQTCEVLSGKYENWGGHTGGYCMVARLDLVIINWFLWVWMGRGGGGGAAMVVARHP